MTRQTTTQDAAHVDALIIGAGLSGMYQLIRLRELGLDSVILEAGAGVGGVWFWNRYPGARFDSESYTYCYSFDKELLQEWSWSEHYAPQHETLRYLTHVAERFDLLKDIRLNSRVASAVFDEEKQAWSVETATGQRYIAKLVIGAVGPLSAPTKPNIPGIDDFRGGSYHTAQWPHEPVSFSGKRVAVIGTGSTGIQTIQEVAKTAGQLTVFQRTPNWCVPLHNSKITREVQAKIKASYADIFARCKQTDSGFIHQPQSKKTFEATPSEREALWEKLYNEPGFGIWIGNFSDILIDEKANDAISEFVARKIRQRVNDPVIAEKLIPKNHGFGTRRVPLETGYFEVYNQDNVRLVDLNETPIERITSRGIKTSAEELEFDIIIYATGFDPVTGSYDRIDIQGVGGKKLKDRWKNGPESFLGMMVDGFPNFFMLMGPHTLFGNIPRSAEYNVQWIARLISHMRENDLSSVEPPSLAVEKWMGHVRKLAASTLSRNVKSWMTGVNSNVEGKEMQIVVRYNGTAPSYREWCDNVADSAYEELLFRSTITSEL